MNGKRGIYRGFWGLFALTLCVFGLSGCIDRFFGFSQNPQYSITGIENDPPAQKYLAKILKERVADDLDYDETSEDFQHAEAAREDAVAADLRKALRVMGYYDGAVRYEDDPEKPLSGVYHVTAGKAYEISSLTVSPESAAAFFDQSLVKAGDRLDALAVLAAQDRLGENIRKDGCYFTLDVAHGVVLDQARKTAALEYTVTYGPEAYFGDVAFSGQDKVRNSYLRKLVPWKQGTCFRQDQVRALQKKLLETGLFSRADVQLPEAPENDGRVDISIDLKTRAQRTVKAGVRYDTDEGPGVIFGWAHRNILGAAETLETELNISQLNQSVKADFSKPFFLHKSQSLDLNAALRQQDTDAFNEVSIGAGGGVTRKLSQRLTGYAGTRFSFLEIEEANKTETYGLLSFPVRLTYDGRNNALDPRSGVYLSCAVAPFYDMLGNSDPFTKMEAGVRTYLGLSKKPDIVLALRAGVGSIVGGSASNVPATERFYAGGGGSVRGFGYQEIGPRKNGDPAGGRSTVTGSAEIRWKFTETLGGVIFADAGNVSEDVTPETGDFSIGAGAGFRYYTGFGPLRFDVAVPVNDKDAAGRGYQFYISIGQAF